MKSVCVLDCCNYSVVTEFAPRPRVPLSNLFFIYCQVARASLQRNNDPLDAAIFYLALKKKAVVWGLYR